MSDTAGETSSGIAGLAACAATGLVFAVELLVRPGLDLGVLYLLAAFAAAATGRRRSLLATVVTATVLVLVGMLVVIEPSSPGDRQAVLHRALVLPVLWGTALLGWRWTRPAARGDARGGATAPLMQRAVEFSPFPIMIHAEDGEVLDISRSWTELTGYTHADIPTIKQWTERAYGEAKAGVRQFIDRLYEANRRVHDGEFQVRTKDGSTRVWDFSSAPLGRLPDGRRLVISMAQDVTDEKARASEIRISHERFDLVGRCVAVWDWDIGPDRVWWNRGLATLFGHEIVEADAAWWSEQIHPDDRERVMAEFNDVVESGRTFWVDEYRFRRADASYAYVHDEGIVVTNQEGEVVRMIGAMMDVTELERTREALQRSNIELQRFAYVASHDLQSPLRGIAGFVQLLERTYAAQLDDRGREWIQRVVEGTQRMRKLIRDLLAYSRVDTQGPAFEPVDLNEVFRDVTSLLDPLIQDSRAEVVAGPLPTVSGDRTQLLQLIQNLIGNAIKYRRDCPPRVELSATASGKLWRIEVRDNGIGIEPAQAERVFEIFRRLHSEKEYPGTGIGLAVCRRVVRNHGGQIWVESTPDEGSVFRFTLPRKPTDSTAESPSPPATPA